ncbi:BZ3500_MvSof-1268-A1-R1_Chr1-2g01464 [Microbotryum saponariae]|uniref:BZ3500_MvSof-1268-A1-R1_Chr1-2g01464 protein n=1 Tax=Microbotryum saponariae TaxID=289078 RepID=A0A2X0KDS2_9BASI|nr:BZ3500_MvSof-1268-A1-R1_Chr1-2g01464 [Microbotryum saponariae]SCZ97472.1 BZ3501_MvSof-1269-A2-R1_Chr1-2g01063 [Microbotryum saponariae]
MPTSRLKPRFPRVKPSDYLDHPDCPDQYADMPLVHVHAGRRFVDKGGRKRPRRADAQSSHTASATSGVNTNTHQRVPVASSSVSTSVFVNDLDFAQGVFDDGQSTGPSEHQDYEYENQGDMDSSGHFRYSPDPLDPNPDLQRPTPQGFAQAVLPPPRASDPPLSPKRDRYLKFITTENKLRENDSDAPSPCDCQHGHVITREVVLYDVTAFYPLALTFCASDPPCVSDVERLAQLGCIASTAARPESAFSFRLIELAEACWKVSPRAVSGCADGLEPSCGVDKEMRKQLQRAMDEFRAVQTLESDPGAESCSRTELIGHAHGNHARRALARARLLHRRF